MTEPSMSAVMQRQQKRLLSWVKIFSLLQAAVILKYLLVPDALRTAVSSAGYFLIRKFWQNVLGLALRQITLLQCRVLFLNC